MAQKYGTFKIPPETTGPLAITGLGFAPTQLAIFTGIGNVTCRGVASAAAWISQACIRERIQGGDLEVQNLNYILDIAHIRPTLQSFNADGFTLNVTHNIVGEPGSNVLYNARS